MKKTFKVSFAGIITAFAFILMLLTSVVSVGTYALPCFSGMLMVAVVIEFGAKWAYLSYTAVSILSLLFAGDKEAALYFVAFFGFYPILKSTIEKLKSKGIQYLLKYGIFNVTMVIAFYIGKFIFMIPDEEFTLFGVYIPWIFLIIGNIFFIFYDRCVSISVYYYIYNIRKRFIKK